MAEQSICILMTMEYPYLRGETFLENEIEYLSRTFTTVIIFALSGKGEVTRPLPSNVVVFPLANITSSFRYMHYAMLGLFKSGIIKRRQIKKRLRPRELFASLYARGRVNATYNKIILHLDTVFKEQMPKTALFYSYWFMDQAYLATLLRIRYTSNRNSQVISRAHGYDLYDYRNKANYIPFRREILLAIDAVYPCSQDGTEYLISKYPFSKEKIRTSYLGTMEYGVQQDINRIYDVCHIATCSNLIPLKRVHLVAEALVLLKREGITNVLWTCIGDGPEQERIEEIIKENDFGLQINMVGRLTNKEVIEFYKTSYIDVFINVSTSEGLPVSIMEAQSFGIPVIATDVGGTREIVNDNTGWLIASDVTAQDLAQSIKKAIERTPEEKQKMRENARNFWEKSFNAETNYKEFYRNVSDF